VLSGAQAAYDVRFYELTLRIEPRDSTIEGALQLSADIRSATEWLVLDLVPQLEVHEVRLTPGSEEPIRGTEGSLALRFERREGQLWIRLQNERLPGDRVSVRVAYGGHTSGPAFRGLNWSRAPSGEPWVTTSVEMVGADVWYPVKDHPSDEPDSVALNFTVPANLVAVSNGRLRDVTLEPDGYRTYHWFVSNPINNYAVALNVAPYRTIERSYGSVSGDPIPVTFWVLPESYEKGTALMPEILDHLRFFEEVAGPYPFRADKYGVVETPYLGMEHQTIIAYGANFDNGAMVHGLDWGFDALHQHELAHEWYGNAVTAADWKDLWLHEAFATYLQPLYLEDTQGSDRYHAFMAYMRPMISNRAPVAPREARTAQGIYGLDIYYKGAWILHTLRHLIGDEPFRLLLRRWIYPNPELERITDGRQTRLADTADFIDLVEALTGEDLDWFFEVYLRQPELPRLRVQRAGDTLRLRWEVPHGLPFPMPVQVRFGEQTHRIPMHAGEGEIAIPAGASVEIDPHHWILRAPGEGEEP
jgi:aminopeptidase N